LFLVPPSILLHSLNEEFEAQPRVELKSCSNYSKERQQL